MKKQTAQTMFSITIGFISFIILVVLCAFIIGPIYLSIIYNPLWLLVYAVYIAVFIGIEAFKDFDNE